VKNILRFYYAKIAGPHGLNAGIHVSCPGMTQAHVNPPGQSLTQLQKSRHSKQKSPAHLPGSSGQFGPTPMFPKTKNSILAPPSTLFI
jgi:hypothetical protein